MIFQISLTLKQDLVNVVKYLQHPFHQITCSKYVCECLKTNVKI